MVQITRSLKLNQSQNSDNYELCTQTLPLHSSFSSLDSGFDSPAHLYSRPPSPRLEERQARCLEEWLSRSSETLGSEGGRREEQGLDSDLHSIETFEGEQVREFMEGSPDEPPEEKLRTQVRECQQPRFLVSPEDSSPQYSQVVLNIKYPSPKSAPPSSSSQSTIVAPAPGLPDQSILPLHPLASSSGGSQSALVLSRPPAYPPPPPPKIKCFPPPVPPRSTKSVLV